MRSQLSRQRHGSDWLVLCFPAHGFPSWRFTPRYPASANSKLLSVWDISSTPRKERAGVVTTHHLWVFSTFRDFPRAGNLGRSQQTGPGSSLGRFRILTPDGIGDSVLTPFGVWWLGWAGDPVGGPFLHNLLALGVPRAPPLLQGHHLWQVARSPHKALLWGQKGAGPGGAVQCPPAHPCSLTRPAG